MRPSKCPLFKCPSLSAFNCPLTEVQPSKTRYLPEWANEPLKFTFDPDAALRRCAYNRLPTSRKKSVKTRLKSR
jgi:hypothetical protein